MNRPLRKPCPEWAEVLAVVSLGELSPDTQAALEAHLAICPACAAVKADYQQMDVHIRTRPSGRPREGLPPALIQLWAEERRQRSGYDRKRLFRSMEKGMRTHEEKPTSLPSPGAQSQRRPMRRLVSGASAVAAVVVIAITVAALVVSHGGQPTKAGSAPKTGSSSTVPTSSQNWQVVPHLTNLPDEPFIAPSNPQVLYEGKLASSNTPTTVTLQRSDDGGAIWHTLPVPAGVTQVYSATFMVSPVSDQSVFVELSAPCSSAQANTFAPAFSPYSGGANSCTSNYFSSDGGTHWSLVHFPVHPGAGQASYGYPGSQFGLQAQGDHLYALVYTPVGDSGFGSSFLSSTNGGATWHFIDQPLIAQGDCVAGYAVTPTGSTVFAATSGQCAAASGGAAPASSLAVPFSGGGGSGNDQLWRSDDAGAHWTLVGPVSYSLVHLGVKSAGQPVLFLAPKVGRGVDSGIAPQFSLDGGKTWQNGPPPDGQSNSSDILGMLSDGSIIVSFTDNTTQQTHLLTWKPGDTAWHQLAGEFHGTPQYLLVIPSGNGQQTVWLVTQAENTQAGSYTVQRLTV